MRNIKNAVLIKLEVINWYVKYFVILNEWVTFENYICNIFAWFPYTAGCSSLQDLERTDIWVEGLGYPEAAAEGATLGLWQYQEHKNPTKRKKIPLVHFFGNDDCVWVITNLNILNRLVFCPLSFWGDPWTDFNDFY